MNRFVFLAARRTWQPATFRSSRRHACQGWLALAAADHNQPDSDVPAVLLPVTQIDQIDRPCRAAIDGRRAARSLVEWTRQFGLSEAEFQLLWRLRVAPNDGLDQTTLSEALAFSPAQISATVERLRNHGRISACSVQRDRRQHRWQISAAGRALLEQMQSAAGLLRFEPLAANHLTSSGAPGWEAAA
jgi:DNA-binding MarR family transcriptional regulator